MYIGARYSGATNFIVSLGTLVLGTVVLQTSLPL